MDGALTSAAPAPRACAMSLSLRACRVGILDYRPNDESVTEMTPLVLLHGFLGAKEDWRSIAAPLAAHRRVLAIDLPGHGMSRGATDADYSVEGTCTLLEQALERLAVPTCDLLGYSMGGRIALAYALSHPHRVRRLVLESASPGLRDEEARSTRRRADAVLAARLEQEGLAAFLQRWESQPLFASQRSLPSAILEEQRRRRLDGNAEELARSLRNAGTGMQPWLGDRTGELRAPTLLMTGALDDKFVGIARDLQARVTGSRCLVVEHAGHNVHLEKPEAFTAALASFLDDQAAAAGDRS